MESQPGKSKLRCCGAFLGVAFVKEGFHQSLVLNENLGLIDLSLALVKRYLDVRAVPVALFRGELAARDRFHDGHRCLHRRAVPGYEKVLDRTVVRFVRVQGHRCDLTVVHQRRNSFGNSEVGSHPQLNDVFIGHRAGGLRERSLNSVRRAFGQIGRKRLSKV